MTSSVFNKLSSKLGRLIKQSFIPGSTTHTTTSSTMSPRFVFPVNGLVKQNDSIIKLDFYYIAILVSGATYTQRLGYITIEYSEDNQLTWLPITSNVQICFQSDDYGAYADTPSNGRSFHLTYTLSNLTTNILHIRISSKTSNSGDTFYFPYNNVGFVKSGDIDLVTPENNIERFIWSFTFTEIKPN